MSFLHQVKTIADHDKKKSLARYYELVRNSAKAGPKEAEEMAELLWKAGKTPEQLDADLRIVREVEAGMAARSRIPALEETYQEANTAHLAYIAECQKRALEQNARIGKLIGERDQRSNEKRAAAATLPATDVAGKERDQRSDEKRAAVSAYGRAKTLMQANPEIFPPDASA